MSFVCHREKILLDEVELRSLSFDRFPVFTIRPFLYFTATDSLKQKKLIFNFFVNRNKNKQFCYLKLPVTLILRQKKKIQDKEMTILCCKTSETCSAFLAKKEKRKKKKKIILERRSYAKNHASKIYQSLHGAKKTQPCKRNK